MSSYHPHHHPLMCLRLYTHGFLIVSIISAVFATQSADAIPYRSGWRQSGDMTDARETDAATSACGKRCYEDLP